MRLPTLRIVLHIQSLYLRIGSLSLSLLINRYMIINLTFAYLFKSNIIRIPNIQICLSQRKPKVILNTLFSLMHTFPKFLNLKESIIILS
jgi:hypothetical protein